MNMGNLFRSNTEIQASLPKYVFLLFQRKVIPFHKTVEHNLNGKKKLQWNNVCKIF